MGVATPPKGEENGDAKGDAAACCMATEAFQMLSYMYMKSAFLECSVGIDGDCHVTSCTSPPSQKKQPQHYEADFSYSACGSKLFR